MTWGPGGNQHRQSCTPSATWQGNPCWGSCWLLALGRAPTGTAPLSTGEGGCGLRAGAWGLGAWGRRRTCKAVQFPPQALRAAPPPARPQFPQQNGMCSPSRLIARLCGTSAPGTGRGHGAQGPSASASALSVIKTICGLAQHLLGLGGERASGSAEGGGGLSPRPAVPAGASWQRSGGLLLPRLHC